MKNVETFDEVIAINVDVQNDFCPGGALAVAEGDMVVEPLNKVNDWVRDQDGKVIFTGDWHPRETAHFANNGGPWPAHCVRYTAGAAFHDDLKVTDNDTVALKGTGTKDDGYSGWFAAFGAESPIYRTYTEKDDGVSSVQAAILEAVWLYKENQRKVAVVIGGLATDYCVKATVLDALKGAKSAERYAAKIGIFVLEDAIRAVDVNPGDGDRAVDEMKAAGAVFTTAEELLSGKLFEVTA